MMQISNIWAIIDLDGGNRKPHKVNQALIEQVGEIEGQ
jgi:hypothetical protein